MKSKLIKNILLNNALKDVCVLISELQQKNSTSWKEMSALVSVLKKDHEVNLMAHYEKSQHMLLREQQICEQVKAELAVERAENVRLRELLNRDIYSPFEASHE